MPNYYNPVTNETVNFPTWNPPPAPWVPDVAAQQGFHVNAQNTPPVWNQYNMGGLAGAFNLEPAAVGHGPVTFTTTESLSSRSSSKPQDPAYQIEESLESLGQELEDLISAKEALSTQVEVLEEMSTAIRSHISTLRKVASQLQTSYPKPPSRRSKTARSVDLNPLVVEQAPQFAAIVEAQAELEP